MLFVPALEGLFRGGRFDLLIALVACRQTAGRADIAVTLLARVHMPVIILYGFWFWIFRALRRISWCRHRLVNGRAEVLAVVHRR
jgi:hypothetical protein